MPKRMKRSYLKKKSYSYMKGGIGFFHANVTRHSTHSVPPSKARTPGQIEINQSQQLEALEQSDFWQGIARFNRVIIVDIPHKHKIYRYFSGNRNFLVREDYRTQTTDRSFEYKDKTEAMRAYNLGRVTWIESIKSSFSGPPRPT